MNPEPTATWPEMDELWRQHLPQVFTLALRLTRQRSDAEDLVQDVFLKVLAARSGPVPGSVPAWLHRVTTNQFLDSTRRRKRRPETPVGEYQELVASTLTEPEVQVLSSGFDPDVDAALATLPVGIRVAVILSDVEQLPVDQVAQALGIKESTVRTRVHRGRILLRRALAHRAPRPGCQQVAGPVYV